MKILTLFGTRPEAIKMAPVIRLLRRCTGVRSLTCATGQHREMLDQALEVLEIIPDYDLSIMTPRQSLAEVTSRVLHGTEGLIETERPDLILVQGDTTSAMAASLAAFYHKVPIGHVEAGLRSGDIHAPWPEEINRRFIDQMASILFIPTKRARAALEREGLDTRRIVVTGNTVVDALLQTVELIETTPELQRRLSQKFNYLDPNKRLVLVTCHRRESFGEGMRRICEALASLASRTDVEVLCPVHLNENVRQPVNEVLGAVPFVHLIEPVQYVEFCYLMLRSYLILTDSGGIQEEAPGLRKPVLVMRDVTERPEGIEAGVAELVGTDVERILRSATRLLDNTAFYEEMRTRKNPYGDGKAALRICQAILGSTAGGGVLEEFDA